MYLVDTARRGEAIAALNQYGLVGRTLGSDLRIRQGRWNFAQLYDWYWYINARLDNVPITSSDINEAENRLVYAVVNAKGVRQLESRLSALRVPCFLVAAEIRSYATPVRPANDR